MENIFQILDSQPLVAYILLVAGLWLLMLLMEKRFASLSQTGSEKDLPKPGSICRNTRLVEYLILNKELYRVG